MLQIRPAQPTDCEPIWTILEPIIRAGEVFTTPRDMDRESALAYWFACNHEVFIAEEIAEAGAPEPVLSLSKDTRSLPGFMGARPLDSQTWESNDSVHIIGTYFLQPNQTGAGAHVANCGYATAPAAQGRGVARAMCLHSLNQARQRGFRAMQFNFVVATNHRALRLWQSCGFETIGRLPKAFHHPTEGYVDACIMYRHL